MNSQQQQQQPQSPRTNLLELAMNASISDSVVVLNESHNLMGNFETPGATGQRAPFQVGLNRSLLVDGSSRNQMGHLRVGTATDTSQQLPTNQSTSQQTSNPQNTFNVPKTNITQKAQQQTSLNNNNLMSVDGEENLFDSNQNPTFIIPSYAIADSTTSHDMDVK